MDLQAVLIMLFLGLFVWGIPLILVVSDPIISKKEKAIWVFVIVSASWFGWLLYQYVAPILPKASFYDFENQEARNKVPPTL